MKSLQQPRNALVAAALLVSFCATASDDPLRSDVGQDLDATQAVVHDASGRTAYIVELLPGAASKYPLARRSDERFPRYHRGNVIGFVHDLEAAYAFEATSMTSWSSTSFTAFLDEEQVAALAGDHRVASITPDVWMTFSDSDTTAVWTDSVLTAAAPPNALWTPRVAQSSEMQPWGKRAVNQATTSSPGTTVVYVVDAGVGQHSDLNVVEWVNANNHAYDCGTRTGVTPALAACTSASMPKLVGCYTHSTAVAGIIGAKANGTGVIGMDPGVKIVSVTISDPALFPNTPTSTCVASPTGAGAPIQSSRVKSALDWVASDIANNNHSGRPSVVNLSMNWASATQWPAAGISAVKADMAALASSTPGAFVVQSAGNQFASACSYAYSATSAVDGVMVVGAINNHGQPVVPLNGANGFWKDMSADGASFGHEKGSNYGACVEAWAPGDAIFTTVGATNSQQGNTIYTTYGYGSGTSFSAPHVAGLAAYLIERNSLTTPAQVEQRVRSAFSNLGSVDPAGGAINLPTLNPLAAGVPKSTVYAEYVLAKACIWPSFATGTPPAGCKVLSTTDPSSLSAAARNRSTLILSGSTNVWMAFDSYGSGNAGCTQRVVNALGSGTTLHTGAQYYDTATPITGNQTALSSCPSASVSVAY